MQTLKELVVASRCRKGEAVGTTRRGAYWLACKPILIRSYGGDGVGNSAADVRHFLVLRHFRDGQVTSVIHYHWWHQNGGGPGDSYHAVDLLECTTVEQVICKLKGTRIDLDDDWSEHAYSDFRKEELEESLTALGMPVSEPAPDEA